MANDDSDNKQPPHDQTQGDDRREFLTKSGTLLAVLAGAGLVEGCASGGSYGRDAEAVAVNKVVQEAIINGGDVDRALQASTATLSPAAVSSLRSLTREDWTAAARLNERLRGLKDALADNNNGVLGM